MAFSFSVFCTVCPVLSSICVTDHLVLFALYDSSAGTASVQRPYLRRWMRNPMLLSLMREVRAFCWHLLLYHICSVLLKEGLFELLSINRQIWITVELQQCSHVVAANPVACRVPLKCSIEVFLSHWQTLWDALQQIYLSLFWRFSTLGVGCYFLEFFGIMRRETK